MRVRVFEETSHTHYGRRYADWQARCDCGEGLHAGDWEACMTWACGHLGFSHPRTRRRAPMIGTARKEPPLLCLFGWHRKNCGCPA